MTEKTEEYWFVLSIIVGALMATFYDVHQYWITSLLHTIDPNSIQYQTVLIKTLAGVLTACTGIGYYFLFRKSRKKKSNQ